ncbi:MAG: hypothetical protein WKG00_23160 [Polyangiaceae bacterium]
MSVWHDAQASLAVWAAKRSRVVRPGSISGGVLLTFAGGGASG